MSVNIIDQNLKKDFVACAYLFSPEHAKDSGFLKSLNLSKVKKAFREKAKQYHPDLHGHDDDEMILKRQERFVKIKKSYEHLHCKFKEESPEAEEEMAVEKRANKPKIIAVGGAKGGIGKSVFASNLSVYLSGLGFKTIAADFDLGGSNLHLFLGKTYLKKNINEYLSGHAAGISEIMERTKYGPDLIGGDSSQLGSSNISFIRKLKLLNAVKKIEADYVVMDLGGDTSYNVLDFFLAADIGIVMTTCDPASYLDAYSFIKVALYRRLNRLFGSESKYSDHHDILLKHIIQEATMSRTAPPVTDIDHLVKRVMKQSPDSVGFLKKVLSDFVPKIIVNKVTDESAALKPVNRIKEVSEKKLSIHVEYICSLPAQSDVAESARTLVPAVHKAPAGIFADKCGYIYKNFL